MCWNKGCIWMVLGVVMLAAAPARGGEITRPAQADAYLSYTYENTNYGDAASLRVGYDYDIGDGQIRNTVIRFDLSGVPSGVPIVRATLGLYCYDTDMGSDDEYLEITWGRLTAGWPDALQANELQVTWNYRQKAWNWWWTGLYLEDRGGLSDVDEYDFLELEPLQVGWVLFEAQGIVEEWVTDGVPNYGFLLYASDGVFDPEGQNTIAKFYSKESTDTRRPYLFIEWDNTPPTPNPMFFATLPVPISTSAITMIATTATDPGNQSPPVWYFFNFVSGGSGGNDSGWQLSTVYTDAGLAANTNYTYRVKARDSAHPDPLKWNETQYSTNAATVTHIETPTGVSFGAVTADSIVLNATGTLTNLTVGLSGVRFNSTTPGGNGGINEWVQVPTDTATGLSPNTSYTFRVQARNQNSVETIYSSTASKVTLANVPAAPTLANPTPTTMTLDVNPNGNPAVTVFAIQCTEAVPPHANWVGKYVNYPDGMPRDTEMWQTDATWGVITVQGLQPATTYTFAVKAKNQEGVETAFGPGAGLATLAPQAEHDLGDAPDSTNSFSVPMTAYPAAGVPANFPTVYGGMMGLPPYGPIHWQPLAVAFLGVNVSRENEADIGPDEDPTNNIIPPNNAANLDGLDDGVQVPLTLPHCQGVTFDYIVTVPVGGTIPPLLYANVWFDWNRDGDWDDDLTCPLNNPAPEWAVQNQFVFLPGPDPGPQTITTPPFLPWHPTNPPEHIWMRITLSEKPWQPSQEPPPGSGGSGPAFGYQFGETEDYYFVPHTSQEEEACCFLDGRDCQDLLPQTCLDSEGRPQGPGSECSLTPQACCLPEGVCVTADPICCDDLGGTAQGEGTSCSEHTIACCLPDGTCEDVDPICCDDIGGTPGFAPACLDDLNGNGIDDACEPPQVLEPKWVQPPQPGGQGFDAVSNLWWVEPGPPPGQEVNKVVADDFISDGRIVKALNWWGSYWDSRYEPIYIPMPPYILDGWLIGFHHAEPERQCPPEPGPVVIPTALGVYFVPVGAVRITPTPMADCFGHTVYQYDVDFSRCCLLCSERDPRLPLILPPARPDGFHEVSGMRYWLSVQAVVGVEWLPGPVTDCTKRLTGHLPSPSTPDGRFWGWHTSAANFMPQGALAEACVGRIVDFTPPAPYCWDYGNWLKQPWLCSTLPPFPPVHQAFRLRAPPCEPRGDMNRNGAPDIDDIPCFVECLVMAYSVGCTCGCADMNRDYLANGLDIQLFVDALLAP